jgi:signal transduction histidine kinase
MREVQETQEPQELRLRVKCWDSTGALGWKQMLTRIKPFVVDGEVLEVGDINLDITELVEAQAKLEEQYHALIELNSSLSTFAYKNAHELRGPLSTIMGLVNLMKEEFPDSNYISFLDKEAEALDHVVRDINDVLASEQRIQA